MLRSKRHRNLLCGAVCGAMAAIISLFFTRLGAFDGWEMKLLDRRYRAGPSFTLPGEIVVVGFDDKDLRRFSPYPREVLAKIVERLHEYGARVIALDVRLDTRRPEDEVWEDLTLVDAMEKANNVVLPVVVDHGRIVEPHPFFRGVAKAVGHTHGEQGANDATVRSFEPILLSPEASLALPSLPLMMKRLARGEHDGLTTFTSHAAVARTLRLPLDAPGFLRIRFARADRVTVRSARELIAGHSPAEWFRDRMVFVGAVAANMGDLFPDPLTSTLPATDEYRLGTPGVIIQAEALAALLDAHPLRDADWNGQMIVLIAAIVVFGCMLFALPTISALPMAVVCSIATIATSQQLFDRAALAVYESPFLAASLLCAVLSTIMRYCFLDRAAREARRTFGRHLHPRLVDELLEKSNADVLGQTQRRRVTILFSDIRNYTQVTAQMSPEAIVAMLNEYFTLMATEVLDREGYIDKYIGDGMMALFGMFSDIDDGAVNAVRAAVAMRDALAAHCKRNGGLQFRIGIGIHTGEVVAGEMGSPQRSDYTVIGADVNLASRVEGMTKELKAQILLTEAAYRLVAEIVEVIDHGEHSIRGFDQPFRLHELVSINDATSGAQAK